MVYSDIELEREYHKEKCFKSACKQDIYMLIILLLICMGGLVATEYDDNEYIDKGRGVWGETWECSQCGYENYMGVNRCGICGKGRYE